MHPKAIITRYYEVWNDCDLIGLKKFLSSKLIGHERERLFKRSDLLNTRVELARSFPALTVTVDDIKEETDRVIVKWCAVNRVDAENHEIVSNGITIYRLEDGKIRELWDIIDRTDSEGITGD